MISAVTFADLAEGEMRMRGVQQAQAVSAVADGADWVQGFADLHWPDAVCILDFPHAAKHGSALVEALRGCVQRLQELFCATHLSISWIMATYTQASSLLGNNS